MIVDFWRPPEVDMGSQGLLDVPFESVGWQDPVDLTGCLPPHMLDGDMHCVHEFYSGEGICFKCGCEHDVVDFQQEWKYYRSGSDGVSRCHRAHDTNKSLLDNMFSLRELRHIPESLRKRVETMYKHISGGITIRGNKRKAIVAACLLHVYRHASDIRTTDELANMFGISKKNMSQGMKLYLDKYPEEQNTAPIPSSYISKVLKVSLSSAGSASLRGVQEKQIIQFCKHLETADAQLDRSSPYAVACAVTYIFLNFLEPVDIETYVDNTGISETTLVKLCKQINGILEPYR